MIIYKKLCLQYEDCKKSSSKNAIMLSAPSAPYRFTVGNFLPQKLSNAWKKNKFNHAKYDNKQLYNNNPELTDQVQPGVDMWKP